MMIDVLFSHNKTYPVTFSVQSSTEVDGQETEPVDTPIFTAKCLCVRGSAASRYVADQFKASVVAAIILKPQDYAKGVPAVGSDKFVIPDGAKATVEGMGVFRVITVDDVGGQGLGIRIPCEEYR